VALIKRLTPVGNSKGFVVDQPILNILGWDSSTEVEFQVKGEQLILTPHRYAEPGEVAESAKRMIARHGKSLDKLGR
jgi:antitoxin component of MazEF toxin-antitoxin module